MLILQSFRRMAVMPVVHFETIGTSNICPVTECLYPVAKDLQNIQLLILHKIMQRLLMPDELSEW